MNKDFPDSFIFASRLVVLFLVVALAYILRGILVPLLFAIIIAITLYPLCNLLEKWRLPRSAASILSVILASIFLSGLIYYIVNQVIVIGRDGQEIANSFGNIYDSIQKWLETKFGLEPGEITAQIREQVHNALSNAGTYISSAFSSAGGTLANVVLVPLYIFFFLYYRDFFKDFLIQANKSVPAKKIVAMMEKVYQVVQSYLLGLIIVMGIVAVLNTAGLLVMGLDYAWFFGILAAILILLPYIGIAIGSIIPALFALATMDSYWYALGVIGWFQVVQFLEGNFITPNIVGGKVSLNPLIAIISLLLGGMLFGLAGLVLAIPLVAVIKILFGMSEATQAFSFLIGVPGQEHLKKDSYQLLLDKHKVDQIAQEENNQEENNKVQESKRKVK
ncbi:AI-2E family transporter [Echinicola jeungdonensis]|uniref:AI-2E family transporter n=1 Tax=Echinicola jeungdonensis TaxID=709343 RepID=A0ABV5JAG6_9BACT|nr:AI-2E family transporter [Echinicola jeungdonensis]MDN3669406.1 AI-2E family transporter [Echinicola jeungdonensis]